ncbi:melatonin receptor type 1C-like [Acanthaster planci]|uniref:Melatonin receptor type 1C-like n=1 Tax=Acanthaster planci TaxID=133434 RepID=A0A8B7ZCR4_ACAPL|nr:melatonin receptor type 1C-like [Acanthaster planci]
MSAETLNFTNSSTECSIRTEIPVTTRMNIAPAATLTPEELMLLYADDTGLNALFFILILLELILGTSGNTLVIAAVLINKKLRKIQYVFVLNLAVADLFVSACLNGMHLMSISSYGKYFEVGSRCEVIGLLCTFGCATSLYSIAAVALNRYTSICHRLAYPTVFSKKTVPMLVACTWLVGVCAEAISWASKGFLNRIVPELFICMSSLHLQSSTVSQAIVFWFAGFGFPLGLIVFSYLRIWLYNRASKKTLRDISGNGSSRPKVLTNTDRRLLRTLLTLVVAVLLLLGPFYLIFTFKVAVPRVILILTFAMFHLNSSINCILYALINRDFRRGYRGVVDRCRRLVDRVRHVGCLRRNTNSDVYVISGDQTTDHLRT